MVSDIRYLCTLLVVIGVSFSPLQARAELGVNDFRGSSFTYSNTVSLTSFDQGAEQTYNPYYDMLFTVAPRYWFLPKTFVSARLSIDKELTEPDDTTYVNETRLSDLNLGLGSILHAWDFGLSTFASLGFQVPTSLASQARTLVLGSSANIALTQALGKIGSVNYSLSIGRSFFEYTTGEIESPLIRTCSNSTVGCDPFVNTGVRNTPWRVVHNVSVNFFPTQWLFLSASTAWIESYLYPSLSDDTVSLIPQEPSNKRVAMSYGLELDLQPQSWLVIALMLNTFNPQLAPDSTYYRPFINRFTTAQLDLRFTLGVFRVAQATNETVTKPPKKLEKTIPPKSKSTPKEQTKTAGKEQDA